MPSEAIYWAFSLSSLHLTPTLLVHACLLPVGRVILQGNTAPPMALADYAALALCLVAIAIKAAADEQLAAHRASPHQRHNSCRVGQWRWSRQPNYFGECLFWTGLLSVGTAAGVVTAEPALCAGTLLMWAFFRFASAPLMDARSLERRKDYKALMTGTSCLLLWPPRA